MACDQNPNHPKEKKEWKPFITSRCSPQRIRSIVTSLSPLQRSYVEKHGFGALLSITNCSLPLSIIQWLLPKVRGPLAQITFDSSKVIRLDKNFVNCALGIPLGCTPVITTGLEDSVTDLKKIYMRNGRGLSVKEVIALMQDDNNEESFIRSFILAVLCIFLCPNSSLNINPQYLHSLVNVDCIGRMDWCSHVLQFLMNEIQKYQDSTDFGRDLKGQKSMHVCGCLLLLAIAYLDFVDVGGCHFPVGYPRIAHLRNEDFEFLQKLPVSSTTHNLDIYCSSEFACPAPPLGDSVRAGYAPISQIVEGIKSIAHNYRNLIAESRQQIISEFIERVKKSDSDHTEKFVAEVFSYAMSLQSGGEKAGTHNSVGSDDIAGDILVNFSQSDSDKDADFELRPCGAGYTPSSARCQLSSSPLDFESPDRSFSVVGAGIDKIVDSHDKEAASIILSGDQPVSGSRKTRKRPAGNEAEENCSNVSDGHLKRLRLNSDIKITYNKYCLSFDEERANEVIVDIDGIYLEWGKFRDCMRPRGNISTLCMLLACKALLADWDGVCSKFILAPPFASLLVVKPDEFNVDCVAKELSVANNRPFPLSDCHVIFLPILKGEHWMLYVVNLVMKEINIFDSFNNVATDYHESIKDNLAKNFSAAFKAGYPSYMHDISKFIFSSPCDLPKQPNNYDCGVYVMKFMESWDGKTMDPFHLHDIPPYRQVLVHRWIHHPRNIYRPKT